MPREADNPRLALGWTGGQYSLVRYLVGTGLAVLLVVRAIEAITLFPERLTAAVDARPAWLTELPTLLAIVDHPAFAITLLLVAALMAFSVAAGNYDKPAALITAFIVTNLLLVSPPVLAFGLWPICVVLVGQVFTPGGKRAPFGSITARGRDNPAGGWRMPVAVFIVMWVALCAYYTIEGVTKLLDPAWRDGATLARAMPSAPTWLTVAMAWAAIVVSLAFAPLALWRVTRPWIWLIALLQCGRLVAGGAAEPVVALVALHLMTFDPRWLRPRVGNEPELLFYDGTCGLCHASVRFIMAEDPDGRLFTFAPLQGDLIKVVLSEEVRAKLPDSIVIPTRDGRVLTRSSAVRHALGRLGGLWRVASWLLWIVPAPIRDLGYSCVARVRRLIFKNSGDTCPVMPGELRARFRL